jgi:hypothetical protein
MGLGVQLHESADEVRQDIVADGRTGNDFKYPGNRSLLFVERGFNVGNLMKNRLGEGEEITTSVVEQQAAAVRSKSGPPSWFSSSPRAMLTADWVRRSCLLARVTCWVSATAMNISNCLKVIAMNLFLISVIEDIYDRN